MKSRCLFIGNSRIRLPVSAKIAFASAGIDGGVPGSPTPVIRGLFSKIATSISSNLLKKFAERIPNYLNVCLHNQILILILLLYGSRLTQLLIEKDSVLTHIILYK